MSDLRPLGFRMNFDQCCRLSDHHLKQNIARFALHRVLEFTGRSIDDVVNEQIAKNEVFGFYKVYRLVERRCEEMDRAFREGDGRVSL